MIEGKVNIIAQIPGKISYRGWCNFMKMLDFIDTDD